MYPDFVNNDLQSSSVESHTQNELIDEDISSSNNQEIMTVAQASDDIGSEKPSTESHEEVSEKATL